MGDNYKGMDAVHADDLEHLLERIGLLDDFIAKEAKCKFCSSPVTHENIYSIIKDSGTHKLVCDRADCVNNLMQFIASRKKRVE